MWRALFLAIGAMLVIVGVETLLIDSATIYSTAETSANDLTDLNNQPSGPTRVIKPKDWMPWTAMSVGSIVVLYAFTLPQRWKASGG